jgi:pyridoxamine 5'-phosphate oxidase
MGSDDIFTGVRKEYERGALEEASISPDPFAQFKHWLDAALSSGQEEPNACALATTGTDGQPSVRMVLLKSFSEAGFSFFTNYLSHKGRQLTSNPQAALLFYWPSLERQIRIEGTCEKVSAADTEAYFYSRPKGAQIGAAVSLQSEVADESTNTRSEQQEATVMYNNKMITTTPTTKRVTITILLLDQSDDILLVTVPTLLISLSAPVVR